MIKQANADGYMEIKKSFTFSVKPLVRRCGDLNPGATCATYRISSADPSTTWVHLHGSIYSNEKVIILQALE